MPVPTMLGARSQSSFQAPSHLSHNQHLVFKMFCSKPIKGPLSVPVLASLTLGPNTLELQSYPETVGDFKRLTNLK